ncbi:MAG: D-aspartate ligase [Bradyrhizobium sp.]|jgi:D-aspartate ligase|nr:D-aspartate ligase [Bradyrhizobium sp.]
MTSEQREYRPSQVHNAFAANPPLPGVVILGGAHGALAVARSFGRQNIPVVLVTDDHPLPKFSRYVRQSYAWSVAKSSDPCKWLSDLARKHDLRDWLLIPCGDSEVALVSENMEILRADYQMISSPWANLRHLCNKQLLAATAGRAGIDCPANYSIGSIEEAENLAVVFPVILKPAMRTERNAFTSAKAWRANSREELIERYRAASLLVGSRDVVVQEFIPGGGEAQFSYAGLWRDNAPVAEMTARRTRQYPVEFGYTSTLVETVSNPEIRGLARKLLSSTGFEGFVEVEFKFDVRDGKYKILDVNPRPWSWFGLCDAAGLDLPGVLTLTMTGKRVTPVIADPGLAWIHVVRDLMASTQLVFGGSLGVTDYLKSISQKLSFAAFAFDDPLPGLLELPSTLLRVLTRWLTPARRSFTIKQIAAGNREAAADSETKSFSETHAQARKMSALGRKPT